VRFQFAVTTLPRIKRRPRNLPEVHARYVRAHRAQLDFRVWVAAGWGMVIGAVGMWLAERWLG